ncbi:MAG TPA: class I SAM-dependent methyltransferase [Pseudomonas sp.]|uniref:class I SAM-dependent methyltransferase n=1 Tax=Pseudomonas sp. TaxID=306 RepID=UPI002B93CB79|nr:class I SAM-dependent methyltransferase [Pseudomonas sp.]HSX90677.1 class I SAM-dependent methyltransferase [Pseudomonas sp.]
MTEQNAYQVADWNGQSGEYWVANQVRLDAMMAVFGQAAIEAAAPATGERVLDVGCGAGASSLDLAARVGATGHVLGVDISEPLIGRACALAPQDTPVLFQVADASSAELLEGAFDILFSRFGVMFFDDPTAAFANMRRALKPGGPLSFAGAAWPRTIGCAYRWARSRTSSRYPRRPVPKRPAHSRSATGSV